MSAPSSQQSVIPPSQQQQHQQQYEGQQHGRQQPGFTQQVHTAAAAVWPALAQSSHQDYSRAVAPWDTLAPTPSTSSSTSVSGAALTVVHAQSSSAGGAVRRESVVSQRRHSIPSLSHPVAAGRRGSQHTSYSGEGETTTTTTTPTATTTTMGGLRSSILAVRRASVQQQQHANMPLILPHPGGSRRGSLAGLSSTSTPIGIAPAPPPPLPGFSSAPVLSSTLTSGANPATSGLGVFGNNNNGFTASALASNPTSATIPTWQTGGIGGQTPLTQNQQHQPHQPPRYISGHGHNASHHTAEFSAMLDLEQEFLDNGQLFTTTAGMRGDSSSNSLGNTPGAPSSTTTSSSFDGILPPGGVSVLRSASVTVGPYAGYGGGTGRQTHNNNRHQPLLGTHSVGRLHQGQQQQPHPLQSASWDGGFHVAGWATPSSYPRVRAAHGHTATTGGNCSGGGLLPPIPSDSALFSALLDFDPVGDHHHVGSTDASMADIITLPGSVAGGGSHYSSSVEDVQRGINEVLNDLMAELDDNNGSNSGSGDNGTDLAPVPVHTPLGEGRAGAAHNTATQHPQITPLGDGGTGTAHSTGTHPQQTQAATTIATPTTTAPPAAAPVSGPASLSQPPTPPHDNNQQSPADHAGVPTTSSGGVTPTTITTPPPPGGEAEMEVVEFGTAALLSVNSNGVLPVPAPNTTNNTSSFSTSPPISSLGAGAGAAGGTEQRPFKCHMPNCPHRYVVFPERSARARTHAYLHSSY